MRAAAPTMRIAVIGSSLGGAAALLASPPLKVDGIVAEAVYPTIERATQNRVVKYLGGAGEIGAPVLLTSMRFRLGLSAEELRPIEHIASINCPVLLINGELDRNTTAEDAATLFARAQSPKELWLVKGAGHVDLHRAAPEEYESRVLAFLTAIVRR